jgi:hypothetical protein
MPTGTASKNASGEVGPSHGPATLTLEPFKTRTPLPKKRSSMDNGAALEEIFGQYFAAIRRSIDKLDPQ